MKNLAGQVAAWLTELGLTPIEQAQREGAAAWDVLLDGRRRRRVRVTLMLDPAVALVAWVHYAPPLTDMVGRINRQLLRWNDELPFVKFALAEDGRPVLSDEVEVGALSRDALGVLLARLLAVCDLLYEDSRKWAERMGRPTAEPDPAGVRLLEGYAERLGELAGSYDHG